MLLIDYQMITCWQHYKKHLTYIYDIYLLL